MGSKQVRGYIISRGSTGSVRRSTPVPQYAPLQTHNTRILMWPENRGSCLRLVFGRSVKSVHILPPTTLKIVIYIPVMAGFWCDEDSGIYRRRDLNLATPFESPIKSSRGIQLLIVVASLFVLFLRRIRTRRPNTLHVISTYPYWSPAPHGFLIGSYNFISFAFRGRSGGGPTGIRDNWTTKPRIPFVRGA